MQNSKPAHSLSLLFSLVFNLLAVVSLSGLAAVFGLLALSQLTSNGGTGGLVEMLIVVFGALWCSILLLPGAWLAFNRLQGREKLPPVDLPGSPHKERLVSLLVMGLYTLVLLAGDLVNRLPGIAWWALPPLQLLAASLPVFWLVSQALRGLQAGSALRRWNVFGVGLVLAPGIIIVIELTAIIVAVIAASITLATDQARLLELNMLVQRLQFTGSDPEAVLQLLSPFLLRPGVLLAAFGFVAVFVPMVEELFKPLGAWFLAGRSLTPIEGFTAGVLSGAGYALFENLFITTPGDAWALVSLGRVGTSTMHILTTGLTGFALASAWSQRRYLRLGVLFVCSILIHALWNSLTLLSVGGSLHDSISAGAGLSWLGPAAISILIALYVALFAGLVLLNRYMRRYAIIPALPPEASPVEAPAEPPTS